MVNVHPCVAAGLAHSLGRLPALTATRELVLCHLQMELTPRNVELNPVASLDKPEWPADGRLRRNVQDHGPVASAAHACVRNAHHVAHAAGQELLRNR